MPKPGFLGGPGGGMAAPQPSGPSPSQLDFALSMLNGAASSAANGSNPGLALLTPILASMIGPKLQAKRDAAKSAAAARLTDTLLGPQGMSPSAKAALEVMNNPDAPDYLQSIAMSMFKDGLNLPGKASGGGHRGGGSPGKPSNGRVYGAQWWDNPTTGQTEYWGNDGHGKMVPILGPDGNVITKGKAAGAAPTAAPTAAPVTPLALPALPTPPMPVDQPTPVLPNDPLGIRQ